MFYFKEADHKILPQSKGRWVCSLQTKRRGFFRCTYTSSKYFKKIMVVHRTDKEGGGLGFAERRVKFCAAVFYGQLCFAFLCLGRP